MNLELSFTCHGRTRALLPGSSALQEELFPHLTKLTLDCMMRNSDLASFWQLEHLTELNLRPNNFLLKQDDLDMLASLPALLSLRVSCRGFCRTGQLQFSSLSSLQLSPITSLSFPCTKNLLLDDEDHEFSDESMFWCLRAHAALQASDTPQRLSIEF
ncbi:hypothetical protein WJX73_000998 [Symbiochloris irregularis]|uniref:Uncharacterized protein n=1 Tax=Symbiochloris irregularis TaxID=706552 RepID=A0AAW1P5G9_9CHLO